MLRAESNLGAFHVRISSGYGTVGRDREATEVRGTAVFAEFTARQGGERMGPAYLLSMSPGRFAPLLLLLIVHCASAYSWNDDSHYVALGRRTGYYIVRPGSALRHQLGIEAAPTIDTADTFVHGYGADALALRFNKAGVLSGPPAYIVQATPNQSYTRRIGSLIRGRSTLRDVQAFFGRPRSTQSRPDGFIAYYAIDVYNPFEDHSGRGRR